MQDAFVLFGCLGGLVATRMEPFFNALTGRGLRILAIDLPSASVEWQKMLMAQEPAHPFRQVDDTFVADANDQAGILEQIRVWTQTYHIRGVQCIYERFGEIAGVAADYLGVPSPGLRAARVCRNKHLQRLYCSEWSPPSRAVEPDCRADVAESWSCFPVVLKPAARDASSGVQLIESQMMLRACLLEYPADELLLLETPIQGCEYSVEALVQQGAILFENVTEKRTNETRSRFFVEMGHTLPAANVTEVERDALLAANRAILQRLAFQDGVSHAEYRIDASGQVWLMEIAARPPGDLILSLYHLATGQPIEAAIIGVALGEAVTYQPPVRYARQVYLDHLPGRLRDVVVGGGASTAPAWFYETGKRTPPLPGRCSEPGRLREIAIFKQRGELLGAITSSFERSVTLLMDGQTPEELDTLEHKWHRNITVVTEQAS